MGAREYDPSLGRWLSADTIVPNPANPQSLNRFSYVYNNPLKYVDPSGHSPNCLDYDESGTECLLWEDSWGTPTGLPWWGKAYLEGKRTYERLEAAGRAAVLPESPTHLKIWGQDIPYDYFGPAEGVARVIDAWYWRNIPSTVGWECSNPEGEYVAFPGTINGQVGETFLFNWRQGEVGMLAGYDVQAGLAIGEKAAGGIGTGPVVSYGASSLEPLAGGDYVGSVSASLVVVNGGGLGYTRSTSADGFIPTVDPVSNRLVIGHNVHFSYAKGAGADVSVTGGVPYMNYSTFLWRFNLWR